MAEDCDLRAVVKLGLALEHSETKSEVLGKKVAGVGGGSGEVEA